ncbi:amidase [Facklamia sp. DSM 111018]|uniref:Amidase n=1 Tax=Facklamia lactis TaxID=2749967 RepID=A0ABS0LN42_9LACT|nr:amidase [Facklamia lactis]MBG9985585.1 amidase [Facklamia lactis]
MLFTEDACFYAEEIRKNRGGISALVHQALANIAKINPKLNAITSIQESYAKQVAKEYDQAIKNCSDLELAALPPFYGVPILLKDLGQNQAGFPSTGGAKLFKEVIARQDSNFTKAILKAGFIIVGRTNTPEFGFKNISDSQLHGRVNSPLDLNRNPGGSSGGAAAALKTGIVPIVTASDGGGSIRIPASFSGVIGLKPSRGRMPVGPENYRGWQGSSVDFALTKSIRDTLILYNTLQCYQPEAPFHLNTTIINHLTPPTRPFKIAYSIESIQNFPIATEVKERLLATVDQLKDLGHELIEDQPAIDGRQLMESYYLINAGVETAAMMVEIEKNLGRPLSHADMETMSWASYQFGLNIKGYQMSQALTYWDHLTFQMESFYQQYDCWLSPTTAGPAPHHGQFNLAEELLDKLAHSEDYTSNQQAQLIWEMFEASLAWTPYTQLMNLTGQPAISLPMNQLSNGLPIGMQFAVGKGQEEKLLSLSLQIEKAGLLDSETIDLCSK